jgi:hypothetical protein
MRRQLLALVLMTITTLAMTGCLNIVYVIQPEQPMILMLVLIFV